MFRWQNALRGQFHHLLALGTLPAIVSLCPLAFAPSASARTLDELVPPDAARDPEGWVEDGIAGDQRAEPDQPADESRARGETDLPWPGEGELDLPPPLQPDETLVFDDGWLDEQGPESELEILTIAEGLELDLPESLLARPEWDDILRRFNSLSNVVTLSSEKENFAQLAVRASHDEELLGQLLRIHGYYDARVSHSLEAQSLIEDDAAAEVWPSVRFRILPGDQFRFGSIDLGQLEQTGQDYPALREGFEIEPGDPVLSDVIEQERADLEEVLGEAGYPFAAIDEPHLLIHSDRSEADLTMQVEPGGKYVVGSIASLQPDFLSSRHLARLARFQTGELVRQSSMLDLRRAILATGLVSNVDITPKEANAPVGEIPGVADLEIDMTEAPLRSIELGAGYGTDRGYQLSGSWEHRNLFPPEGMLRLHGILGTREQEAGVTFRRSNLGGRDRILTVGLNGDIQKRNAYKARRATFTASFEKKSTILYQKGFAWGAGIEATISEEAEKTASGKLGERKTYKVGAIPLHGLYDTTTDLLDPVSGFKLALQLSPEISLESGNAPAYLWGRIDASTYFSIGERSILALRGAIGSIVGTELDKVAPSRRMYAGGGHSVRGYGYESIGKSSVPGQPNGGRSLAEFSIEARIQTSMLDGALSVVPFIDAGTVGPDSTPNFKEIRYGAGVGLRYQTDIGPLRLDLATPINPRPQDGWLAVYASLGQAF